MTDTSNNDDTIWEDELSSIIERTSNTLKQGRVPLSSKHAWNTTSATSLSSNATPTSTTTTTTSTTSKKNNTTLNNSKILQDTTKISRNKINSTTRKSKHKSSNSSRKNRNGNNTSTTISSSSSAQHHMFALTNDLRRTVTEMEEEILSIKRNTDTSNAQILSIKDECLLYRDGVEHVQTQMNHLAQRGIRYELDIDNVKRTMTSMDETIRQLQVSIQERSTRGEVNAR